MPPRKRPCCPNSRAAWVRGLKTTYYLCTMSARRTEKSTVEAGKMNAVSSGADAAPALMGISPGTDIRFCVINDSGCGACQ